MAYENVSSISKASSLEEMADFWDTHSLADYDDEIYEKYNKEKMVCK